MWFQKLWILAILLGFVRFLKSKWEKSQFMFMEFWQSLETASVKTDADGKTMMHLPIRNNVTDVVM
jgi:hypothetical protein